MTSKSKYRLIYFLLERSEDNVQNELVIAKACEEHKTCEDIWFGYYVDLYNSLLEN